MPPSQGYGPAVQTIFIRRGEFLLTGSGSFAMARKLDKKDSYLIVFHG